MALQMMHTTSQTWFYGPQIVLDDLGGRVVKMSMADLNYSGDTWVETIHNHVMRSVDNGPWDHSLMTSVLMDDLSPNALLETIRVVPNTGNLYGLIRDGEKLYLARYLADTGWSKLQIPDVPSRISRENLQFTTNETGMVTLTWHTPAALCCNVEIHAKHFMAGIGWQETDTISVGVEAMLTPHVVDTEGRVHSSWLVSNPDLSVGGYNMKMATFTPMVGWSTVIDGPEGLQNASAEMASTGDYKVVAVTNLGGDTIDAYVVQNDGTWTKYANINNKINGDGVSLIRYRDTQVITGGNGQFMIVWRESVAHTDGTSEVRYTTANFHKMPDPTTGMLVWHLTEPSQVGGTNMEVESNISFAMDSAGNSFAVWTSVEQSTNTSHVYANQSAIMTAWGQTPEMLAEYDIGSGASAVNTSITINAMGKVGIAWDQHMMTSTTSMHHVWVVEDQ